MRFAHKRVAVAASIVAAIVPSHVGAASAASGLKWAGHNWRVRTWAGAPAVNGAWSDRNVRVDGKGNLHLRVGRSATGALTSAEIESVRAGWGYGTYRFVVGSRVDTLPRNVVVGLFTYDSRPEAGNREIDVEASAWGSDGPTVWDHTHFRERNGVKTAVAAGQAKATSTTRSTHEVTWQPGRITWRSWGADGTLLRASTSTRDVPRPGQEKVLLNLWVFGGAGWRSTLSTEVVIEDFSFRRQVVNAGR
jgi:beta-glucanase (GH16 family)